MGNPQDESKEGGKGANNEQQLQPASSSRPASQGQVELQERLDRSNSASSSRSQSSFGGHIARWVGHNPLELLERGSLGAERKSSSFTADKRKGSATQGPGDCPPCCPKPLSRTSVLSRSSLAKTSRNHVQIDVGDDMTRLKECRFCLSDGDEAHMINVCNCSGTSAWLHYGCLRMWVLERRLLSCELCGSEYFEPHKTRLKDELHKNPPRVSTTAADVENHRSGGFGTYLPRDPAFWDEIEQQPRAQRNCSLCRQCCYAFFTDKATLVFCLVPTLFLTAVIIIVIVGIATSASRES